MKCCKKMSHINKNESFCHHSCTLHPCHTIPNASISLSYKLHACVYEDESKLCCLHHINNIFCVPFTYFINESFFLPLCFPFALPGHDTHTRKQSQHYFIHLSEAKWILCCQIFLSFFWICFPTSSSWAISRHNIT